MKQDDGKRVMCSVSTQPPKMPSAQIRGLASQVNPDRQPPVTPTQGSTCDKHGK